MVDPLIIYTFIACNISTLVKRLRPIIIIPLPTSASHQDDHAELQRTEATPLLRTAETVQGMVCGVKAYKCIRYNII